MNKIAAGAVAGAVAAIGLVLTPSSALAADCGSPAEQAVFRTVTTPAVPAVEIDVLVIDSEATPEIPAVYEDVKVVDVEAKDAVPAVPAVYEDVKVIDVAASPGSPEVPAVEEVSHIERKLVKEAYTETIVDKEAYTETIAGKWWNWSPNDYQGPQDFEPAFPVDERGTWQGPHTEGGPDGEGTFNASHGNSGNSSWFHRDAAQVIEHPAETHDVVHDAVYEDVKVIDVPAKDAIPAVPPTEEVSHIEHQLVTPEIPGTPAVEEVSHIEHRLVTEAVPAKEEVSHLETIELSPGSPATKGIKLVSAAVPAGEACPTPAALAFTGSELVAGGLTGALLLAGGVLLTVAARRRTQQD